MSDMTPPPSGKASRRWLGPAFLASLALNLFLVALIAVAFVRGPADRGFGLPRGHEPALMHGVFKELPEEDRQLIRRTMRERFREIRPHIRQSRKARDELADALAAQPYDEAAAHAAFDRMAAAMAAMSDAGRDAMMEMFAKLTPEQRQRMAEAMRKDRERMKVLWRKNGGERRDEGAEDTPDDVPPPPME